MLFQERRVRLEGGGRLRQIPYAGPYYYSPAACQDRIQLMVQAVESGNRQRIDRRPYEQGLLIQAMQPGPVLGRNRRPRPDHSWRREWEWSPNQPAVAYCSRIHKETGTRMRYNALAAEDVLQLPEPIRVLAKRVRIIKRSYNLHRRYFSAWPVDSQPGYANMFAQWEEQIIQRVVAEVLPSDLYNKEIGFLGETSRNGEWFYYKMNPATQ